MTDDQWDWRYWSQLESGRNLVLWSDAKRSRAAPLYSSGCFWVSLILRSSALTGKQLLGSTCRSLVLATVAKIIFEQSLFIGIMNIALSYKLYTENLPSVNDLIFQYVFFTW